MLEQKRKEQLRAYEKQEKNLGLLKGSGKSTKQAVIMICMHKLQMIWNNHCWNFKRKNHKRKLS